MNYRIAVVLALALAGCQTSKQDAPAPDAAQVPLPAAAQPAAPGQGTQSPAAGEALPQLSPLTLSTAQTDVVKMGVANKTKNMETATFGAMAAGVDTGGVITVCGLVYADNGKGGMTGMQPFIGVLVGPAKDPTDFTVANMGDGGDFSTAIRTICQRQGTPIPG